MVLFWKRICHKLYRWSENEVQRLRWQFNAKVQKVIFICIFWILGYYRLQKILRHYTSINRKKLSNFCKNYLETHWLTGYSQLILPQLWKYFLAHICIEKKVPAFNISSFANAVDYQECTNFQRSNKKILHLGKLYVLFGGKKKKKILMN